MSELYQLDLKEILAEDFESIDSGKHDNLKISSLIILKKNYLKFS